MREFTILMGPATLGGNWISDTPPHNPCSGSELSDSMNNGGSAETAATGAPGIWTATFPIGSIILSGGYPEDGVYANVGALPEAATPTLAIVSAILKDPIHGAQVINATIASLVAGVSSPLAVNQFAQYVSKYYSPNPTFADLATDQITLTINDATGTSYTRILGLNYSSGQKGVVISGTYDLGGPPPIINFTTTSQP